VTETKFGTRVA